MVLLPWRFWSVGQKVIVLAPLILLVASGALFAFLGVFHPNINVAQIATGMGLVLACLSLGVSAFSSAEASLRSKRQATIDAWSQWMDETNTSRRWLSNHLGGVLQGLTATESAELLSGATPVYVRGKAMDREEKLELLRHVRRTLNQLERLAVGVELGVYDADVLVELGGTIIVTTHSRFEEYIIATQRHPDLDRRKPRAFRSLGAFVRQVESRQSKRRRRLFDIRRVRRVRRV